jgi:hypothetical protein
MPNYNFFALDHDGRITAAGQDECSDDFRALERARSSGCTQRIEVWEGRRRVGRVEPRQA